MILEFLKEDYSAITMKLIVVGILWCAVLLAMMIDFYFGIRKARQIGEVRSSEGYKRSVSKFNQYFGMLLYAFIFDAIVPISYFFEFPISAIPIVSLLATVALVFTEAKSVHEKADEKQRRKVNASLVSVLELMEKKDGVLKDLLSNYKKEQDENNSSVNNGTSIDGMQE
ncbi:phage holin family protein [Chryseobacterium sp. Ch-15]|uniref:Phage holin family protein n=1 Tax=Chryseobacterium muglaense TaxID=2893752 RepID=A0A9Q3YPA3_9FLAO|nr:phage holin family protein [Chryseobacterium muglaense]MBD3904490.1 phage holin family protein [Chryseobacterium muglaense]MCC9032691.1 phage holin family protein [Chryseobacterium muglaense]MCM2554252.1 phage holin family protein [Chryseobacterium muglaense]